MGETLDMNTKRDPDLTPITESVVNLDKVIKIDAYIPGCPPRKENILGAVAFLIKTDPATMKKDTNVCATCKASPCLLEQGKLCWGNITAGGCSLMCPNDNLTACTGCFGKSNAPDAGKAAKLKGMLESKKAGLEDANLAAQFILLYHGLPPQGSLYLTGDPLRQLALGTMKEFSNDVVGATLKTLANNPNYQFTNSNVCATCDRNGNMNKKMTEIKRYHEGPLPDDKTCFINQGMICMGPMTQAGCGAICPNNGNSVCSGCYGPVFGVPEQGARGISTIASLADVDIDAVKNGILDPVGLFYRYTLAVSEINKKVNDTPSGGEHKQ
jgi:coenzyme F420-reducing hydrogenase gamma subunit